MAEHEALTISSATPPPSPLTTPPFGRSCCPAVVRRKCRVSLLERRMRELRAVFPGSRGLRAYRQYVGGTTPSLSPLRSLPSTAQCAGCIDTPHDCSHTWQRRTRLSVRSRYPTALGGRPPGHYLIVSHDETRAFTYVMSPDGEPLPISRPWLLRCTARETSAGRQSRKDEFLAVLSTTSRRPLTAIVVVRAMLAGRSTPATAARLSRRSTNARRQQGHDRRSSRRIPRTTGSLQALTNDRLTAAVVRSAIES